MCLRSFVATHCTTSLIGILVLCCVAGISTFSSFMEKKTPIESAARSAPTNIVTAPEQEIGSHCCVCGIPNCEKLRARALAETPPGHPWRRNGGLHEVRVRGNNASAKVEALRRSCVYQLRLDPSVLELSRLRVAHIHWPPSVLQQSSYRTPLLSQSDAKKEDKSAGYAHRRFFDKMNNVGHLLEKNRNHLVTKAEKGKYVQATTT
jgi:hypothetical protein